MLDTNESQKIALMTKIQIAIFVVLLFCSGIIAYFYNDAFGTRSQEVQRIATLVENIRSMYSQSANYGSLSNETVIDFDLLPEGTQVKNALQIQHAWGGLIAVQRTSGPSGEPFQAFRLVVDKIPQSDCLRWVQGIEHLFYKIVVNEVEVKNTFGRDFELNTIFLEDQCLQSENLYFYLYGN